MLIWEGYQLSRSYTFAPLRTNVYWSKEKIMIYFFDESMQHMDDEEEEEVTEEGEEAA